MRNSRRRKKIKRISIILGLVLGILLMILLSLLIDDKEIASKKETMKKELALDNDLTITSVEPYSGKYVEDGSDDEVKDVLMITIRNDGTQSLQYAELNVEYGEEIAEFSLSTLKPGESVLVLEKNKIKYREKSEIISTQLKNVVYFQQPLTLCEDILMISAKDGAFNVENVSGQDLKGQVAIYYKNKMDDSYLGGITYRAVIEEGIEKDGIKQIMTSHYIVDKSEVIFVTYIEKE